MKKRPRTVGFGAANDPHVYVFEVRIPRSGREQVRIVECYGTVGLAADTPTERAQLDRPVWEAIAATAGHDFNARLAGVKLPRSRWKIGTTRVERLLGRELCVLAWAAETAAVEERSIICSNWAALRPEERWWLYAMTATEAGLAQDRERGWRKALHAALADGTHR